MARLSARDWPERERRLTPVREVCPDCGQRMRIRYDNCRNLVTLSGMVRLRLRIRRCETPDCLRFHLPYRPEAEGALALPHHEFGLDVVALVGVLRHRDHRSVPEIHALLRRRGLEIAERSVTNLLDRYDELLATGLTGTQRLRRLLKPQGGVILALDGLQPDVGHEVLWVVRDCLSGAVLLARSLLSARAEDLEPLLREAMQYALNRWEALARYLADGRLSIDNNLAERLLRGIALTRKNFLFLGSDTGGDRAAIIYTVAETAKLNGLDPEAYIAAVLDRLARGHTIDRIDQLLPWNFTPTPLPAETG